MIVEEIASPEEVAVRSRWAVSIAIGLWALTFALLVLSVLVLGRGRHGTGLGPILIDIAFVAAYLTFTSVGAVVAAFRPGNPAGWLMLSAALLTTAPVTADVWAGHASATGQELRDMRWVLWLSWIGLPASSLFLIFLPLVFPPGGYSRDAGGRWRGPLEPVSSPSAPGPRFALGHCPTFPQSPTRPVSPCWLGV